MSRDTKRTLLQRLRRNAKHVVPKSLRKPREWSIAPEDLEDLCQFTGLSEASVLAYVKRERGKRISDELDWLRPRDAGEYGWFYRASRIYLFEIADAWEQAVALARPGMRCLDFGGGGGRNALGMAGRGAEVFYVDIGVMNAAFVAFRARKRGHKLTVIDPVVDTGEGFSLDTVEAARRVGGFDLVVCDNVLEHVPDYHDVVAKLAESLSETGRILECTPFKREKAYVFKRDDASWDVHLKPSMPMIEAMTRCGMKPVAGHVGLWERA